MPQDELDDPGHQDHDIGIGREPPGDLGPELLALLGEMAGSAVSRAAPSAT